MTYVQQFSGAAPTEGSRMTDQLLRNPLLLVIEDGDDTASSLQEICDFLDVVVERMSSEQDVAVALREYRPMGVVTHGDCRGQDGCHVMMAVAKYDFSLPIMMLVGDDPAIAGAVDAVEELWKLGNVTKLVELPGMSAIVEFLFRAGRKGHCTRFLPI
jgi:DNA-binding NtrC family response regulator